jgi:regulator of sigma E protease
MTESPGIGFTILAFLLAIGPLIFIHELGHYLVGRWCGVKADVFSIGFGREIFGWTDKRGTRWKVSWLPLGGYVKFAGDMNPASTPSREWLSLPPEERAVTFQAKPVWKRFLIVLAGPLANFLFAITVFCIVFGKWGVPITAPVVAGVQAGTPAEVAGLRPGDRVLSIDGRQIDRFEEIYSIVSIRPRERLNIEVDRGGNRVNIVATTGVDVARDNFGNEWSRGYLGIAPGVREMQRLAPHQILGTSVSYTFGVVRMIVETLGQIVTGKRSVKEMGGPLKIAQFSGQQATLGFVSFLMFMTLISINLGFINLLPIPMLDGGHLLFYAIEGVRRRPLHAQAQEWAFRAGLAALLMLMVLVTFNDLASFGLWQRLGGLIG